MTDQNSVGAPAPSDTDLLALYEAMDAVITTISDDARPLVTPFRVSYRDYRLSADPSHLARARAAYPIAQQAMDAHGIGSARALRGASPEVTGGGTPTEPTSQTAAMETLAGAATMDSAHAADDARTKYPVHPAAAIFPMMNPIALAELAADIKKNGLREAIILCGDMIADGRNRDEACRLAGVAPRYKQWDGEGSLVSWVLSANLHRRHLTGAQRALVAAQAKLAFEVEAEERRLGNLAQNKPTAESAELRSRELGRSEQGKSAAKAAAHLQVSTRAVEQASTLTTKGDESLIAAVKAGTVSLDAAVTVARLPHEEQQHLVKTGQVKAKAAELRRAKRGGVADVDEKAPQQQEVADETISEQDLAVPGEAAARSRVVESVEVIHDVEGVTEIALLGHRVRVVRQVHGVRLDVLRSNGEHATGLAAECPTPSA